MSLLPLQLHDTDLVSTNSRVPAPKHRSRNAACCHKKLQGDRRQSSAAGQELGLIKKRAWAATGAIRSCPSCASATEQPQLPGGRWAGGPTGPAPSCSSPSKSGSVQNPALEVSCPEFPRRANWAPLEATQSSHVSNTPIQTHPTSSRSCRNSPTAGCQRCANAGASG